MKIIKVIFLRFIALISMSLFAGCAAEVVATYPDGGVVVAPGPPPFVGAVWIGGEYRWRGGHYVLEGGHWAHSRTGRSWQGGSWQKARGGYTWQRGHWR